MSARNEGEDKFALSGDNVSFCQHEMGNWQLRIIVALNATLLLLSISKMKSSIATALPMQAEEDDMEHQALLKCNNVNNMERSASKQ